MDKLKYVNVGEHNDIIIFSATIQHSTFKRLNPVSAGFCSIHPDKVVCYGKSVSLNMNSAEDDSFHATKELFGVDAALRMLKK